MSDQPVLILQGSEAAKALREIAAAIQPEPEDRFLSLAEAAKELGMSRGALAALAHDGKIPCRDLGSRGRARFVFSRNALSKWLGGG